MSNDEETFRRLAVELRILEGTADTLQSRINLVNAALTELTYANMTLEGIEKEKEDAPLFVPIGGGSYIKAKLGSADTVIVGIGAEVAVEKTLKEAKELVKNRIAELEKNHASLQQQLAQVIEKIREDRAILQEVTRRLSQKESRTDVRKAESGTQQPR
ncbi:MAG: prefoldin subunit alpha [Candidatus Bathyarchaeia archaeon]